MQENINNTKEIIVDGSLISTKEEFFETLKRQLGEDILIGNNLDALHDALTSISHSVDITVLMRPMLEHNLGSYWDKIYRVIMDSLDENYNLSISFDDEDCEL